MANSDKDILITPSTGSSTASPKIEFVGANSLGSDTITMQTLYDGTKTTLSFEGSAGDLFSIVNDLTTNPIFSVNNASGVSCIEVDNNGGTRLAEFSGNVGIGNSSPTQKLDVTGNILASGTLTASGGNSGNWNTAYGWGNHASAGYLTFVPTPVNGSWWNSGFVSVGADGVMEVGKYLDFHTSNTGGNVDYDLRVTASPGALSVGGTISATGGNSTNWNTAYGWGNHASQSYATQSYVGTQISNLVAAAPATLDTLNELAAALGDDPNFATTVSTSIGTKWTQDNTKISQWNTAYGWGNHASAGYLTSYTDTNTTYSAGTGISLSGTTFNLTDTNAKLNLSGGTLTGALTITANEGREVESYLPSSYATNDIVAGHRYGWYNDNWYVGMSRSGDVGGAAFRFKFNTAYVAQVGTTGVFDGTGYRIGTTTVIDSSRNLTNIGTISSGVITATGAITSADFFKATGNNLKFSAGGNHIFNVDLNGKIYPQTHNAVDIGFSNTTAFRNLYLSGTVNSTSGNYTTTSASNTFTTQYGNIQLGPMNGSWAHIYTNIAAGFYFNKEMRVNNNLVWNAGNDGSGSGLDADLLDGQQPSALSVNYANTAGSAPANGGTATALNGRNYISRRGGTGNYNTDFTNVPAGAMNHQGDDANSTNNPGRTWWFLDNYRHSNSGNYWGTQVAWGWEDNSNQLSQRNISGGNWSGWVSYYNSGNDGSGSGLDADLLDGQHGSYYYSAVNPPPTYSKYLRSDTADTASGTYIFNRTTTTAALDISGHPGAASYNYILKAANDGGNKATMFINGSTRTADGGINTFTIRNDGGAINLGSANHTTKLLGSGDLLFNGNKVWHQGNDGSGSGLDADLLDGQHGSYYAPASHIHSYLPLSGGTLTGTLIGRDIRIASGYNLQRSNHHTGNLEGSYNNVGENSGKSNPIYTIGSSYNPADSTLSNMYGIGYSHTNASFYSGTGLSGWGMYVAADGDARVFLCGSTGVINSTGQHYVGSNVVWNAGNDGSGSGLDADLLDGVHGSSFLRSDANDTASGQYLFSKVNDHAIQIGTIRGLAVGSQGGQFIQLYERVNIGGPSGWGEASTTAAPSNGLSTYGGASLATHTGSVTISGSTAWHAGNDGSGSGLDADLLDGYQLSTTRNAANTVPVRDANGYANFGWINTTSGSTTGTARIYASNDGYIRYVTPTTFRNNLGLWWTGNDGSGSGLDADLLDGQHGSYYAPASHNHSGVYLPVSGKAVDSELLDGIDSSRFIYGSGNVGKSTSSSSFQAQPSGFFFYSAATGAPTTEWYNWITARGDSWGNGGEYSFQLANSFWNKKLYFQHVQTGGYQGWDEIWTSATDGAGSGLDADLLDGQHGSYYAPASHVHSYLPINNPIATGILVAPDIRARKSQTQGNYTTAALWTESHSSTNTGIAFHISGNVGKMLDMRTDGHLYWENGRVWSATSDGSGSGLDADLLDGQHGSYYYPASNPNGYTSNVGDITGVTAGNGLTGGGSSGTPTLHVGSGSGISVAADTVGVDSSVIRTTGAQSMSGVKTHTSRLALSAGQMLSLGDTNHHLVQVATGYSGVAIDGPRLQGHQGGELATNIGSNQYALRWDNGGNTHSRVSSRAPIFYDTNNTNYYVDPAGTGTSLRIKGDILCDDNYGKGFVGKYSASRLQHVFSMGAAYRLAADGTTSGNLYGMAWSHPNAGSIGGANNLSDHGLLIINNGVFKAAISSRAVFSQDVRGTRFYDYNSTGYYVDPAATSVLNIVQSNEIVHYNSTSSNVENYLSGTGNSGTKLYWRTDSAVELMNVDMSGNFTAKGNVIAYSASDRQLKENIKPIKNALEKVLTIGGYEFDWNSKQTAWSEGTHDIGVIAQEIELVAPEATRKRADGYLGVDYEKLIPLLIESIKELNSKVETLELQLAQKEQ